MSTDTRAKNVQKVENLENFIKREVKNFDPDKPYKRQHQIKKGELNNPLDVPADTASWLADSIATFLNTRASDELDRKRITPDKLPYHLARMIRLTTRINRADVADCNHGHSEPRQVLKEKLLSRIADHANHLFKNATIYHQGNPRGNSVYIIPESLEKPEVYYS